MIHLCDDMALKQPNSMDELVYFTQRTIEPFGKTKVWVFKQMCPKCKKGLMGKPVEKGKIKPRAKECVCPECKYTVNAQEYEDGLTASIEYTCPKCQNKGEIQIPYKRKSIQGVKALVFNCQKCNEQILVSKKMKAIKPKKGAAVENEADDDDDE